MARTSTPPPALAASSAAAASAPSAVVEITARHHDNAVGRFDAASEGVVRAALLDSRPLLRPGEVLEAVPGLLVTQHSGDGKANQYFLRGFNLDHGTDFATHVDGVPANMPTHAHGQGYTDLNFLIPELIEHIDYRKGPYFAANGDFAAAGSADIELKRRLAAPFSQLTVGANGYRRWLGADSQPLGDGAQFLGAVEAMGNDGPWTLPEGLHRDNVVLMLSGAADAGSTWSTSLLGYDARWRSTDQVPLRLIEAGTYLGRPFGRFDAVDPTDGGRTARSGVTGSWHGSDASGDTSLRAYAVHSSLTLFSNFTYFMDRPATGDQFSQQESRDILGLQAQRRVSLELGDRPVELTLGADLRHDRIRLGLYESEAQVIVAATRVDDVRETLGGVYAQAGVHWAPWLHSLLGVRADAVDARVGSVLQPLNSGHASDALVSPKLALVLGPWAQTEFFLDAGNGYHSNDARGMTAAVDPVTNDPQTRVPPLVRARGAEIGLRTEAVPGLQSSLALWQLDFDSELTYSGDEGTTSANGPSRRYGVEWNNHWLVRPGVQIDLDLAWNHARFRDDESDGLTVGPYVPNSVDRVATATITLDAVGPWRAGFKVRTIGSGALTADGSVRSSPSTVGNLRVQRRFGESMMATLDVLNVFDRRFDDIEYDYATQLRGESAPVAGKVVHPGEPRTLRATWRLSF